MSTARPNIGFIGLGQMGAPMARNLSATEVALTVYDSNADTCSSFKSDCGSNVSVAESLRQIGRQCSLVILMLPNGAVVRDVVLGSDRSLDDYLLAEASSDITLIDMSSSSPTGTRQLGHTLAQRGIDLFDAPVSGGVKKAVSGELAIMVGATESQLEPWKWILNVMGSRVFALDKLGNGHAMKALNNYLSAVGLTAACEALVAAERFGLSADLAVDVLNASSGRNNTTENKLKQFILSGTYNAGFAMGLMAKDLKLAEELTTNCETQATLLQTCRSLWDQAQEMLGPSADHTEYMRYVLGTS